MVLIITIHTVSCLLVFISVKMKVYWYVEIQCESYQYSWTTINKKGKWGNLVGHPALYQIFEIC